MNPNLRPNFSGGGIRIGVYPGLGTNPDRLATRNWEVVWPNRSRGRYWWSRVKISVEGHNAYVVAQETFATNPQSVSLEGHNAYVVPMENFATNPQSVSLEGSNVYVVAMENY